MLVSLEECGLTYLENIVGKINDAYKFFNQLPSDWDLNK